jgi:ribosomal protein S27AE
VPEAALRENEDGTLTLTTRACPKCRESTQLVVAEDAYNAWRGGELIQRAFPEMSRVDRERLISGYCGPCFDEVFAEDEG